jgi:hypothetical protein
MKRLAYALIIFSMLVIAAHSYAAAPELTMQGTVVRLWTSTVVASDAEIESKRTTLNMVVESFDTPPHRISFFFVGEMSEDRRSASVDVEGGAVLVELGDEVSIVAEIAHLQWGFPGDETFPYITSVEVEGAP